MTSDPVRILTRPIRVESLIFAGCIFAYICISLLVFFLWVDPSITGRTDQHIAADSTTYIQFANEVRDGVADPILMASLLSFPNTLICPVALALLLKSTLATVVANYLLFLIAFVLLKKTFSFSSKVFLLLMFLNATTSISLLSVNKEIVDLFAVCLFLFSYRRHHVFLLLLAISIAFFNRFEVGVVMLTFLFIQSRFNPFRQKRVLTLTVLLFALSVMLPILVSKSLNDRFADETGGGHAIVFLDTLEIHFLYAVAFIPKVAESLLGEFINLYAKRGAYLDLSDIANTYIIFFNNLSSAIVLLILMWQRKFKIQSDIIYMVFLGWIIMAIALVIQPRYIYFIYVLLCLQAAQTEADSFTGRLSLKGSLRLKRANLKFKRVAFE